ncbi:MAG: hypothetical protein AAFY88_06340, partial [Acidobacteriota bacterium]
ERVYSTCYDGILERWHGPEGTTRDISVWPEAVESWPAAELRYRFTWDFPIAASPHAPGRLYAGSHVVHQSDDRGESWREISPDLTTANPELMQRRGGLTLDDAGPTVAPSLSVLAESPLLPGDLWAGTNDGRLHRRRSAQAPWVDITERLPGLPALGTLSDVECSPLDADVIYVSVDRHRENDRSPWVYRSRDGGDTWSLAIDGLGDDVFSYVHALVADPVRPGLLFAGTEGGLFYTLDAGDSWRPVAGGLPPAPVYDLKIQERFGDLVVATYGRGFWILDDLSALRQLPAGGQLADGDGPRLLAPRPALRFRPRTGWMSQPDVPAAGENPRSGAPLHYLLPEAASSIKLEVLDASGRVIRGLTTPDDGAEAGVHRVWWDLHHDPTPAVRLRTRPDERPDQALPPDGFRALRDGRPVRLLARPGTYRVRLTAAPAAGADSPRGELSSDGPPELVSEVELELQVDPASRRLGVTDGDFDRQYDALFELRDMAVRSAALINEIEWLRAELLFKVERLASTGSGEGSTKDPDRADLIEALRALERDLAAVEGRFFDLRLTTDGSQDTLRWKRLLWSRIGYLASRIGAADAAPTPSQLEVLDVLRGRLRSAEDHFREQRDAVDGMRQRLDSAGLGFLPRLESDDAGSAAK